VLKSLYIWVALSLFTELPLRCVLGNSEAKRGPRL
jgi:hypothetical protein